MSDGVNPEACEPEAGHTEDAGRVKNILAALRETAEPTSDALRRRGPAAVRSCRRRRRAGRQKSADQQPQLVVIVLASAAFDREAQ